MRKQLTFFENQDGLRRHLGSFKNVQAAVKLCVYIILLRVTVTFSGDRSSHSKINSISLHLFFWLKFPFDDFIGAFVLAEATPVVRNHRNQRTSGWSKFKKPHADW